MERSTSLVSVMEASNCTNQRLILLAPACFTFSIWHTVLLLIMSIYVKEDICKNVIVDRSKTGLISLMSLKLILETNVARE